MQPLRHIPVQDRLNHVTMSPCRPLPDAQTAIRFAIDRFHESWSAYRTITPTLYPLGDGAGVYVTLGRLRKKHGLSWDTLEAIVEALAQQRALHGFIVAAAGVGGDPLTPLFTLQGHAWGEPHRGALDLTLTFPFEGSFESELELSADAWQARWAEAASNANLLP